MAFQKIICGPIVRRTESSKVSVWVAFMSPQQVTLKIWQGDNIKHSGANKLFTNDEPILASVSGHTLQFGAKLYIALLTAEIPVPGLFPTNVYSYNMEFNDIDSPEVEDFRSDKLLRNGDTEGGRKQLAIGYEDDTLPSFVLPGTSPDTLNVVHGSCRKMHGFGNDALSLLDGKIKATLTDPSKRPQVLFLTGDQIYADEVPGMLLRNLGAMDGNGLFGGFEKMKIKGDDGTEKEIESDIVSYPPFLRQKLVNKYAGFSSVAAANHLLSFEEFCGTYLYYWNVRSWNNDLYNEIKVVAGAVVAAAAAAPGDNTLVDAREDKIQALVDKFFGSATDNCLIDLIRETDAPNLRKTDAFIFSDDTITKEKIRDNNSPEFIKWEKDTKRALKKEVVDMAIFFTKLPEVSRVLANISTYMILDDHEVTDDLFITQRWNNQVFSKPFGRDIIRNAFMAYAVFQDWGNVPDEYQKAVELDIDEPVGDASARSRFMLLVQAFCFRYAENVQLGDIRTAVIDKIEVMLGLSGSVASLTWNYNVKLGESVAIVLDTRTQRFYQSLNTVPELISDAGLTNQLQHAVEDNPAFLLVISPCPVLGLPNFEELVQPAATAVMALMKPSEVNPGIVGGQLDFDYEAWGFNVVGFERLLAKMDNLKNVVLLSGDVHYGASAVLDYWKGLSETPTSRIIQLTSSALKNEWLPNVVILKSAMVQRILTSFNESLSKLGWKDKIVTKSGPVTPRNRQRLLGVTTTIPIEGWTPGATLSPEPDFRWRLKILKDERQPLNDFVTAEIDLADPAKTKEGYFQVVQRHQEMFIHGKTRRIAWKSNIGLISFTAAGDSWKLKHELLGADLVYEVPLATPQPEQAKPVLP